MRSIKKIYSAPEKHWVGDGFHVAQMFSHMSGEIFTSPFLLLDYAKPREFSPNSGQPRGVGPHPHRGFETVTIAYHGEIAHRDTSGGGGVIKTGDVQWMTAGDGIVHEEFHSQEYSQRGGLLEMVQLWVNLPKKDKRTPARYQHLASENIPVIQNESGIVRVIAGQYGDTQGVADTFTEMNVWDVRVEQGKSLTLNLPETHNVLLVVRRGELLVNQQERAGESQLVTFEMQAGQIQLDNIGNDTAEFVLLSGVPIDEPVVGYGPFVMNTQEEILQSIQEFRSGKYGEL